MRRFSRANHPAGLLAVLKTDFPQHVNGWA
jgi:hypothetical protein